MIDMFVIGGVDYSLFVIVGIGALIIFAAQYALCCKAKSKWIKLIPVYFLLLILAISTLVVDSTGSIISISNVVMVVLLCIDVLFAIAVGAAWVVYKVKTKGKAS